MNSDIPPNIYINAADFNGRLGVPNHAVKDAFSNGSNPWEHWFGSPTFPEYMPNSDGRFSKSLQLPYAYQGKNQFLEETIFGLINDNSEWLLAEPDGLPIEVAHTMSFTYSTTLYEEGMLDIEPEEGIARLMRSSTLSESGTLIRKGKCFEVEHGFHFTAPGQQSYYRQLQQIANASKLTMAFDTLTVLVRAKRNNVLWDNQQKRFDKPWRSLLADQFKKFARLQKDPDAGQLLVTSCKKILKDRNVTAETIIVPEGGEYFFRGVGDENLDYAHAGPEGPRKKNTDPYSVSQFYGLRIRYTRSFKSVSIGGNLIDPLMRHRVVGEYFKMFAPRIGTFETDDYKTSWRDIFIMDFNRDDWARITLQDVVKNLEIFDDGGELNDISNYRSKQYINRDNNNLLLTDLFYTADEEKVARLADIDPVFLPNDVFFEIVKRARDGVFRGLN